MGKRILVAEGDSWFDFGPLSGDILSELEKEYEYDIRSVARHGHKLKDMLDDFKELEKKLEEVRKEGRVPRAVLLSGGGNDFVEQLRENDMLLPHNDKDNPKPPVLDEKEVDGLIKKGPDSLRFLYIILIIKIKSTCKRLFPASAVPVLVHGYASPVPDGRCFEPKDLREKWAIADMSWLKPSFEKKGYKLPKNNKDAYYKALKENAKAMNHLIDEFNKMLELLPDEFKGFAELLPDEIGGHVKYVNLRGCMSNEIERNKHENYWRDELHPTEKARKCLAKKFHEAIDFQNNS